MRIIFIRHGDPDYEKDSLTPKGFKEAELLSERMGKIKADGVFVSPLGRAGDTAAPSLKKMGVRAEEPEWLKEFPVRIIKPDAPEKTTVAWDWLPEEWTKRKNFFESENWFKEPEMAQAGVEAEYKRVCAEFDKLLAAYGYVREGAVYRVEASNTKTLVFFCHFGITCVFLSHLMNVSPMILWHGTVLAPTSVTSLYSEERRKGTASFRANMMGDISHLYVKDEEPAFSARFCETFESSQRHD